MSEMLARFRGPGLARAGALALLGLGLLVVDAGGCGLSTEGSAVECKDDLECADDNPCNIETCGDNKKCAATALPDGPAPFQIPGDCKQATCEGGEAIQSEDETDRDDGNPCTEDACDGGLPTHTNVTDVECSKGGLPGTCKIKAVDGEEVAYCSIVCTGDTQCDDNFVCTLDSCDLDTQECFYQPNHGALVSDESPIDCRQVVCNQDQAVPVANDSEIPDDGNDCTTDTCDGPNPVNDPAPNVGKPCGDGLVCNANGDCVGCVTPDDCDGVDNECQRRTCIGETCGIALEPYDSLGNPALAQPGGDCKTAICDGNGGTTTKPNSQDTPPDDSNPCTAAACSGDVPYQAPLPLDTACPGGYCNGAPALCVQCNNTSQCPAPPPCKLRQCSNNSCVTPNVPSGQDPNNSCDANPPCGQTGECNGNGGCALAPNTTPCGPAQSCSGGVQTNADFCNGAGACTDNGTTNCSPYDCNGASCATTCSGNNHCLGPTFTCQTSTSTCKKANGQGCGSGGECTSTFCADGVCCNAACGTPCYDCNSSGQCVAVTPSGTDDNGCTGANQSCDGAGNCKLELGQPCTAVDGSECFSGNCVDGFCCNSACTSTCQACSAAKTDAGNGTCANITNCTDPDEECSGGNGSHECTNGACAPGC